MGFWDTAAKLAQSASKKMSEINQETENYKERYRYSSREELIERFKRASSFTEKTAIGTIMKEKGWLDK